MALVVTHQTKDAFALRFWTTLRNAYESNTPEARHTYHKMVWRLWSWVTDGDLTTAQVRNSYNSTFGTALNSTQWNALMTSKFVPIKDAYLNWLSTAGPV